MHLVIITLNDKSQNDSADISKYHLAIGNKHLLFLDCIHQTLHFHKSP